VPGLVPEPGTNGLLELERIVCTGAGISIGAVEELGDGFVEDEELDAAANGAGRGFEAVPLEGCGEATEPGSWEGTWFPDGSETVSSGLPLGIDADSE